MTYRPGCSTDYPTQTAAWADVDHDGFLDLFVGYEISSQVDWPKGTPNFQLYLNNGDGTFTDVGADLGHRALGNGEGGGLGRRRQRRLAGPLRLDARWPQSPLPPPRDPQRSGPMFADVTARAGVAEPRVSFTTWFFDYDNDGWLDIFVTGYFATLPNIVREVLGQKDQAQGERPRLYHNNHDGTFTDVSRQVGLDKLLLTMGANFGDLDNDGWLDFYLGTGAPPLTTLVPNRMFRNDRGKALPGRDHLRRLREPPEGARGRLRRHRQQRQPGRGGGHGRRLRQRSVLDLAVQEPGAREPLGEAPAGGQDLQPLRRRGETAAGSAHLRGRSPGGVRAGEQRRKLRSIEPAAAPRVGRGHHHRAARGALARSGKVQEFRGLAADRTYELREEQPEPRVLPASRRASASPPP